MGAAALIPVVTLTEAQAYVRIETGDEEAVVAGLIRTATALCEAFLGQALIARAFSENVSASGCWQRLTTGPVQAISGAEMIGSDGTAAALASSAFAVDIDSSGTGWVRLVQPVDGCRLRVSGTAGMADAESDVPEPIRQGVLRLVAHLFAARDGGAGEPPAAVTALWRPYRRMALR
jgi:uncharacterized phiE125 gp8 family phage protein